MASSIVRSFLCTRQLCFLFGLEFPNEIIKQKCIEMNQLFICVKFNRLVMPDRDLRENFSTVRHVQCNVTPRKGKINIF